MLQVARLAPKTLGGSAELVQEFLLSQQNADGGFKDRTGRSDLYYTVFGLDSLIALQAKLPSNEIARYLEKFGDGKGLDFVHLCCLARGWAALANLNSDSVPDRLPAVRDHLIRQIEAYRRKDGGFHPTPHDDFGTVYGCFLALGAYQDCGVEMPDPNRLTQCLNALTTEDGAWANDRIVKVGSTNATAAAVTLLRNLNLRPRPGVGEWLFARCHSQGGFLASPSAPIPDLLSTATSLHALAGLQMDLSIVKERCLDFVDSLWTNEGSFHGNWTDEALDSEYTFYGLLALGHLSI